MIRKMLVGAAALALPAAALAGVTAVGGSSVAGATKTYATQTCVITGGVTFAAPGLSNLGTLGKKSSTSSAGTITATGTGCANGTGTTATAHNKLTTPATDCTTASPAPAGCAGFTTKAHYLYGSTAGLLANGVSTIVNSLSKGVKLYDNGNKVTGTVTLAGTTRILPGGTCGTNNAGYDISGTTNVTGLTYDLLLCIVADSGPGSSGVFGTDVLNALGGNKTITIATGTYGGLSKLTLTKV